MSLPQPPSRVKIAEHFGVDEYANRKAYIYHSMKNHWFEVDYYEDNKRIEVRKMVTDNPDWGRTVHSQRYAEDAAENYCLGYMQVGDGQNVK